MVTARVAEEAIAITGLVLLSLVIGGLLFWQLRILWLEHQRRRPNVRAAPVAPKQRSKKKPGRIVRNDTTASGNLDGDQSAKAGVDGNDGDVVVGSAVKEKEKKKVKLSKKERKALRKRLKEEARKQLAEEQKSSSSDEEVRVTFGDGDGSPLGKKKLPPLKRPADAVALSNFSRNHLGMGLGSVEKDLELRRAKLRNNFQSKPVKKVWDSPKTLARRAKREKERARKETEKGNEWTAMII